MCKNMKQRKSCCRNLVAWRVWDIRYPVQWWRMTNTVPWGSLCMWGYRICGTSVYSVSPHWASLSKNKKKPRCHKFLFFWDGGFTGILKLFIQHCFICRPSDSTVSEDAGIAPRNVATKALAARRSNYSARSHPPTRLDFNHTRLDLITLLDSSTLG